MSVLWALPQLFTESLYCQLISFSSVHRGSGTKISYTKGSQKFYCIEFIKLNDCEFLKWIEHRCYYFILIFKLKSTSKQKLKTHTYNRINKMNCQFPSSSDVLKIFRSSPSFQPPTSQLPGCPLLFPALISFISPMANGFSGLSYKPLKNVSSIWSSSSSWSTQQDCD